VNPAARREAVRQGILEATYECVARWGLSKTTVADAARQAGVSRATVYRYFPAGREELLRAVVAWEQLAFFARLYEEVRSAESLEEVMERGLPFAARAIKDHEVLQRVLAVDPEMLLPALSVESARITAMIAGFLVPYLERHELAPGVVVDDAADLLARMTLSYIASPGRWDLDDPGQVARLVRAELLGGVVPPAR